MKKYHPRFIRNFTRESLVLVYHWAYCSMQVERILHGIKIEFSVKNEVERDTQKCFSVLFLSKMISINNITLLEMKKDKKEDYYASQEGEGEYPEYPEYPPDEDIYKQFKEEDLSEIHESPKQYRKSNEKDFNEDMSGYDIDVPGSELDDDMEIIGSEDEENNLYSLGGDDHEALEENNGD